MPQAPQPPKQYTLADSIPLAPPQDPIASLTAALRGHYEFERELGQGAFATVYLARDLKHERKVAIKVLRADPNSEMGELRFVREIRMLARLQHPNILPLHDSGHVENLLYYVMPYVSGETLRDRLRAERQLPWETACNITCDVADALAYAHGQGIIHRDIKPENILLSAGHPMIADFGIARAIDVAGVKQLTRTGMGSPGTPAYMSPEQLLGVSEIDVRSDIYSLGCVLYEMLTGSAPFADDDTFVKRFTDPAPSAADLRPELPEWIDAALRPALERDTAARYSTAAEFASALRSETITGARARRTLVPMKDGWRRRLTSKRILIAALVTAAILTAGIGTSLQSDRLQTLIGVPALDSTRFIVLVPSTGRKLADSLSQATGEGVYESLRSWNGLNVASDQEVADAIGERGTPSTLREGMQIAAALRAGRMIWGRVITGNVLTTRLELFDVTTKHSTGRYSLIETGADSAQLSRAIIQLLAATNRPARAADGDGLTKSFAAWTAYNAGHLALASWNLTGAEQEFRRARAEDPNFPLPHLWLAQIGEWRSPGQPGEWRESAIRAASAANILSPTSSLMANALASLANKSYPSACERYSAITRMDSLSFVGWYGLGECQSLDSLVLPTAKSPSGWQFRSSTARAADAYMRALSLEPRSHTIFPFDRLTSLLPVAASRPRGGYSGGANPVYFAASPSVVSPGDTLAFIPYPRTQFAALPTSAISSLNAALERNTAHLTDFAASWTRQAPQEAAAFEALADMLDTRGEVFDTRASRMSALTAISRARLLSTSDEQKLRTAAKAVWIHFKRGEFAVAQRLADSILSTPRPSSEAESRVLLGLAALTGNFARTTDLVRDSRWYTAPTGNVPEGVADPAARLFTFAVFGICDMPRWIALRGELNNAIDNYVEPRDAERLRAELLTRPLSLMSPCTQGSTALEIKGSRSRLVLMQQAFARKDMRALRSLLDTVAEVSKLQRPGDLSPDYVLQQAWLRVAVGDTTQAERLLDKTLNGLPGVSTSALQEPAAAAGIVRVMRLRAQLAAKAGDDRIEQKWSTAAKLIWAHGDPSVQ